MCSSRTLLIKHHFVNFPGVYPDPVCPFCHLSVCYHKLVLCPCSVHWWYPGLLTVLPGVILWSSLVFGHTGGLFSGMDLCLFMTLILTLTWCLHLIRLSSRYWPGPISTLFHSSAQPAGAQLKNLATRCSVFKWLPVSIQYLSASVSSLTERTSHIGQYGWGISCPLSRGIPCWAVMRRRLLLHIWLVILGAPAPLTFLIVLPTSLRLTTLLFILVSLLVSPILLSADGLQSVPSRLSCPPHDCAIYLLPGTLSAPLFHVCSWNGGHSSRYHLSLCSQLGSTSHT